MVALISKPVISLPTQDNLPYDDNENMETHRHKLQMDLLLETIYPWLEQRKDGYAGGNMFVYFSASQLKNEDYKGPDFFAVLDVPQNERKSWVVWEEGKAPDLVIELLSETTAQNDKTGKKLIYQNQMRVPEYFWYDPFNPEDFVGFTLRDGVYQPLTIDSQDRYISQQLQLALIRWQGTYYGVKTVWLRWQTLEGELLPTQREFREEAEAKAIQAEAKAIQAEAKAIQAEAKAIQAEAKATKLAAKLEEMGINPDVI
jgi:Uma2 family endonuclease